MPTLAEVAASRKGKPIPKGASRLQLTVAAKNLTVVDDRTFKREVRERDRHQCRKCGRKVVQCVARIPERGEVHHVHGRRGDLRFETRAALLLCLSCHEQVTGRVNERWIILASKTFTIRQGEFTNASYPVSFERVA